MHVGGFAVPGGSRGLRGLQRKVRPAAYCQSLEPWARLKFHAGWQGGVVGHGSARLMGFLKGSERPEAGCLGANLMNP